MYFNVPLLIFALPLAVESRSLWNLISNLFASSAIPEDAQLNISQLAYKYGYNFEQHKVITEDGYFINIHRIPRRQDWITNGSVVFLMHGIIECSDSWLLQGPNNSLAYVLANEGFDVWMGNGRGNKHCTEHATWNYSSSEFWQFTWEEIGVCDLPATIDYILNTTGKESLYYVGHSQGTTIGYVLLSMKPEYNQKIKLMFSLAPEAWMGNAKSSFVRMLSPAANELGAILDGSVFSSGSGNFNKMTSFVCNWLPINCDHFLYTLVGPDTKIDDSLWPVIFGHMPAGASTLQFVHYGQLVNSKRFCRFDHGEQKNMEVYGQATAPDYNLNNIVAPVVLYYSSKDWLSDPHDVKILKSKLPNVFDTIYFSDFDHLDYVYAGEAHDAIYMRIVAQINKFERQDKRNSKIHSHSTKGFTMID